VQSARRRSATEHSRAQVGIKVEGRQRIVWRASARSELIGHVANGDTLGAILAYALRNIGSSPPCRLLGYHQSVSPEGAVSVGFGFMT
jgi:hypothetical protein